ncbi:MAG: (deoxy)nucleoside triphosphate pyrophosphohydrolase [Flavobacteriia bacterium]|nr:(deoxy)nucleoside triphosphate pyrophosphohydrolase [Flavobacteriia bacterium]
MGIEVVCAMIVKNGRVWMGQRPNHKHMGGFYEFPGGKVHDGEGEEEALKRELLEELGVKAEIVRRLGEVEYAYPEKTIRLIAFEVFTQNRIDLKEHIDERWIEWTAEAHSDWAPADRALWHAIASVRRAE